jgi:hypothetical protein
VQTDESAFTSGYEDWTDGPSASASMIWQTAGVIEVYLTGSLEVEVACNFQLFP